MTTSSRLFAARIFFSRAPCGPKPCRIERINTPLRSSGIGTGQAADLSRSARPRTPDHARARPHASSFARTSIRCAAWRQANIPRALQLGDRGAASRWRSACARSWWRAPPFPCRRARPCAASSTPSPPTLTRSSAFPPSTAAGEEGGSCWWGTGGGKGGHHQGDSDCSSALGQAVPAESVETTCARERLFTSSRAPLSRIGA
jgi:hypothetical protein